MNFELNEDQKMVRDMVRRFAENEIAPIADEIDRSRGVPQRDPGEDGRTGADEHAGAGGGGRHRHGGGGLQPGPDGDRSGLHQPRGDHLGHQHGVRGRSTASVPRSRGPSTSPRSPPASTPPGRSPSPSPGPAPTPVACAPRRCATATTTSSTAPRCSSPPAPTPGSPWWRRRPTRTPASGASACSWWSRAPPGSRWGARRRSWASAPPTPWN